ncbi:hypothetical protein BC938DRAFT_483554 [Jimgerdemannia flammicorona]|uniref:Uncharacterized protein n=1 Tax=Jimgerdemannia flammicorona TaxID=994334 RepID=A0A433QBT0_9FUNG|nr:hypothetical protein BC938DRAFT_483554 [Jimgerdemannia flammicorona]
MTDNSGLHMPYGDDTEEHADEINDELGDDDYEEEQDGEPSDEGTHANSIIRRIPINIAAQHQRAILFFTDNRLLLSHATATRLRRASAGGSVHDNPPSNSASNDDDDRDDDDADPDSHQMQARALLHAIYQPTQRRRSASRAIYQSTQRKQSAPRLRLHQGEHAEQQREGARELLASGEFGAVDSSFGHERVLWGGGGGKGRGEDLGMSEGLAADGERRGGGPSVSLASRIWEREARWKPVSQVSLGRVSNFSSWGFGLGVVMTKKL